MIILISRKVFQNSFRNTFIPQWICLQGNNDFSRNHINNLKLPSEEAFAQTKFFSYNLAKRLTVARQIIVTCAHVSLAQKAFTQPWVSHEPKPSRTMLVFNLFYLEN